MDHHQNLLSGCKRQQFGMKELPREPDRTGQSGAGNSLDVRLGNGSSLPPIPHISSNIIPLSNVLKFYTQEAYKQLTTAIENLATSQDLPDIARKKSFLTTIIDLRQDFIKIYTLVKWAVNSKDVGTLIDLLNWFRLQEFHFEKLSFDLNSLNSFSGAKLPNSDIATAIEVLLTSRPSLPSYNFIPQPKILSKKVLEVLENLNLVLATRMALNHHTIPSRFTYKITDGRIHFTVPNEFKVSITVANDLIVENEDYEISPFYFVDFAFLFGLNPESGLISHKNNDENLITKLPPKSHEFLEKCVNNALKVSNLTGMYDLLHKYSVSFRLYLIAKQLKELIINSKWRNNIQFDYQNGKSLIVINYWQNQYLSKNWKSFIELGIDKSYNLNFRWFKNGKYFLNHGIELFNLDDNVEPGDLSVDLILNTIVNRHSEVIMTEIFDKLEHTGIVSYLTSQQLIIKISPNKSAIFAINPLTGFFYFIDPTPIQENFTKLINSQPNIKKSLEEKDMVTNIVKNLVQLRLQVFNMELNNKLITTGWINNSIIKLNDYETSKLFNLLLKAPLSITKIQFYRQKNWPSSWFLIELIKDTSSVTYWWVARIKSIKGEWKIQWLQNLNFNNNVSNEENLQTTNDGVEGYNLNYEFFNNLPSVCSNMILDHMILEELQVRDVDYVKTNKISEVLEKFGIAEIPDDDEDSFKPRRNETTITVFNKELIPVAISTTALFLKIKLTNSVGLTQMKIKLFGKLSLSKVNFDNLNDINLQFNNDLKVFEINDILNLDNKLNGVNSTPEFDFNNAKNHLLDNIFNNLHKLSELIKILDELNQNDIEVVDNSITRINIKIDEMDLRIQLPEVSSDSIKLIEEKSSSKEFTLILSYLNEYIVEHKTEPFIGVIKYLKLVNPIITSIGKIRNRLLKVDNKINGMKVLNFDVTLSSISTIQFLYHLNYSAAKKIQKDKLVVDLSFKCNKFSKIEYLLIKLLMKNNWNSKNAKYKSLFESIFKSLHTSQTSEHLQTPTNEDSPAIMKLDRDVLISPNNIEKVLIDINECFVIHLNEKSN